jgi:hypothetical protein
VNGAVKQERFHERYGAASRYSLTTLSCENCPKGLPSGTPAGIILGSVLAVGIIVAIGYKICKNTIRGDTSSPTETANVEEPQVVTMKDDENENEKKVPSEEVSDTKIHHV